MNRAEPSLAMFMIKFSSDFIVQASVNELIFWLLRSNLGSFTKEQAWVGFDFAHELAIELLIE
ncbi:hypothetical protein AXF42_Ash009668 [Apostasia shenzhenica]|uniref:Uncharacterized protein n=1 Tax=Apostasia shenzhenica TaxID=1088818 RepID=A0A2I0AWR0_9ASPA|nr:hypothetical protein AXF42_Ash009668 [Apostasia shenzhenica]